MGTGLHKIVNGEVFELTQEEVDAMETYRVEQDKDINPTKELRDQILRRSDCAMIADFPKSSGTTAEWKTYRQELRDCLDSFEKGSTFVFPKSPIIKKAGQDAYDKRKTDGLTQEHKDAFNDPPWEAKGESAGATDEEKEAYLEAQAEKDREGAEMVAGYPHCGLNPN